MKNACFKTISASLFSMRCISSRAMWIIHVEAMFYTHTILCFDGEFSAQPLTAAVEDKRQRNESNHNESQQAITPTQPEMTIQGRGGQRKESARRIAQKCDSRKGRRCCLWPKDVYYVYLCRRVGKDCTRPADGCANDGHDPMHFVFRSPAIDEQADR